MASQKREVGTPTTAEHKRYFTRVIPMFGQSATRVAEWYDYKSVFQNSSGLLRSIAGRVNSTSKTIAHGMSVLSQSKRQDTSQSSQSNSSHESLVVDVLFSIMASDTEQVLRSMRTNLAHIERGTMDDALLQENLQIWRKTILEFREVLPKILYSLRAFFSFTERREETDVAKIYHHMKTLEEDVKHTLDLAVYTQRALSINISIIDSKKGIAEAEAVTRLTELAVSTAAALYANDLLFTPVHLHSHDFCSKSLQYAGSSDTRITGIISGSYNCLASLRLLRPNQHSKQTAGTFE